MTTGKQLAIIVACLAGLSAQAFAASDRSFSLQVVLDGATRPEYRARGTIYVEAVRGREFALRITNPLPVRVAVALAVDGLNTIDAEHGDARSAAKWVLGPHETIEIAGWQSNGSEARRFFFTGERASYGAWLGQTDNLGVIEAVFYREKPAPIAITQRKTAPVPPSNAGPAVDRQAPAGRAGAAAEGVTIEHQASGADAKSVDLGNDFAATGIGQTTRHEVEWVHLDLEDQPAATVRIRYEFREQLARLGVLPPAPDPIERRERARGFTGRYCPDPSGGRF